jgi:hypothetical protein
MTLNPDHRLQLTKGSGIAEGLVDRVGWTAAEHAALAALGFDDYQQLIPALVLPISDVWGRRSLHQIRPDHPRIDTTGKKPKVVKYETPAGGSLVLSVLPEHLPLLPQVDVPLLIAEGMKKQWSIASRLVPDEPLCLVGIIGVDGWMRQGKPLPDWDRVTLRGRKVTICFDSDVQTKTEVKGARNRLARFLRSQGAHVQHMNLPVPVNPTEKCGADDFFVQGHTLQELLALTQETFPAPARQHALRLSWNTIRQTEQAELTYVVEDILPAGTTLLVGKSKDGKSLMAYNLAVAVASGGIALGKYPVEAGSVWYLALEDGERRAKKRLLAQEALLEGGLSAAAGERLTLTLWEAPRIGEGLEDDIREWITTTPDARLLIIDILEKVRPRRTRGGSVYEDDYQAIAPLTTLAQAHDVAILIVHHANKTKPEDFRSTASGAESLLGGADNFWCIRRLPLSADATMDVTGRDIEHPGQLALRFQDGYWTVLGDAGQIHMHQERLEIVETIRDADDQGMTAQEVATAMHKNYHTTHNLLKKLLAKQVVVKDATHRYTLTDAGRVALAPAPAPAHERSNHSNRSNHSKCSNRSNSPDPIPAPEPEPAVPTSYYGAPEAVVTPEVIEKTGGYGDSYYDTTVTTPPTHTGTNGVVPQVPLLPQAPDCVPQATIAPAVQPGGSSPPTSLCGVCRTLTATWQDARGIPRCVVCYPQPTGGGL